MQLFLHELHVVFKCNHHFILSNILLLDGSFLLNRCIVMVGLPYANIKSPELKEKMDYLNANMVRTSLSIKIKKNPTELFGYRDKLCYSESPFQAHFNFFLAVSIIRKKCGEMT